LTCRIVLRMTHYLMKLLQLFSYNKTWFASLNVYWPYYVITVYCQLLKLDLWFIYKYPRRYHVMASNRNKLILSVFVIVLLYR
jgi:hypothetical protein